jgi:hypothetical protein
VNTVELDAVRLCEALVEALPDMLTEVSDALAPQWPEHAAFVAGAHAEVAAGGELAMALIVNVATSIAAGRTPDGALVAMATPMFHRLGRTQARSGESLPGLLSAYQAGARAAWRHMARTSVRAGLPPEAVAHLAEALFWLIDQLSAASARGFTEEQSAAAVAGERLRSELAELLLSDRSDSAAIAAAAARAGWTVPSSLAVLAFGEDAADLNLSDRAPDWLSFRRGHLRGLLVPEGAGRVEVAAAVRGTWAVIGPHVSVTELPATLDLVAVALRLRRDGQLSGNLVYAADHLDALIVHRDPRLHEALAVEALAPLAALAEDARERLAATLRCWLDHLGDTTAMAAELHVHPQTVRYRMGQLRELFGPAVDDPAYRRRLILALCFDSGADAGHRDPGHRYSGHRD